MPTTQSLRIETGRNLATDIRILAGSDVGPSHATVRDVLGTFGCNLAVLSRAVNLGDIDHVTDLLAGLLDGLEDSDDE